MPKFRDHDGTGNRFVFILKEAQRVREQSRLTRTAGDSLRAIEAIRKQAAEFDAAVRDQ